MFEVIITVNYKGKNYRTNVLANKGMTCEKIMHIAEKQVEVQWGK